jgi:hypothetical protein
MNRIAIKDGVGERLLLAAVLVLGALVVILYVLHH